jgi:hypothetical protein
MSWGNQKNMITRGRLPTRNNAIRVSVDQIKVPSGHRAVDQNVVCGIAESVELIGLQNPIGLIRKDDVLVLKTGRHRLEAFKLLGEQTIPARILNDLGGALWRHSDNLHRSELKGLDRSEAIVGYSRARRKFGAESAVHIVGRQPHDRGISSVARALKLDRKLVRQAMNRVQNLHAKTKVFLRANGLDNNEVLLDELARCDNEAEQLKIAKQSAGKRRAKHAPGSKNDAMQNGLVRSALIRLERSWQRSGVGKRFAGASDATKTLFIRRLRSQKK